MDERIYTRPIVDVFITGPYYEPYYALIHGEKGVEKVSFKFEDVHGSLEIRTVPHPDMCNWSRGWLEVTDENEVHPEVIVDKTIEQLIHTDRLTYVKFRDDSEITITAAPPGHLSCDWSDAD